MARTALLCLLPAALVVTGWRQLEFPAQGGELALAAALGIAAALLPRGWPRFAGSAAAFLTVVHLAFGLRPVGGAFSEFGNGLIDYYEVTLPFAPGDHQRMHGVLVLAVFAFVLGASLGIAGRRAVLAAGFTFAGAAWPVTLIRDAPTAGRGALLLVAALLLLAVLRPGPRPAGGQAALVGGAVLLAALIAVSSPAVAKGGFLDWEQWEPYTRSVNKVDVSYVWNSNYDGIRFPEKPTTVLKVKAPGNAPYWRATTLDDFIDGHWREPEYPLSIEAVDAGGRDALLTDPLLPAAAWQQREWMHQEVTGHALRDTHLVGASAPIAFERGKAVAYSPGVAYVGDLRRGDEYDVWSYVKRPTPRELTRSRPDYPLLIESGGQFLGTPSGFLPPFGVPNREERMRELFEQASGDERYRRLYDIALEVAGKPRNPYAAVIALEAWFRVGGNFDYDETPPMRRGMPPLVAFVTRDRQGYCQHFAGAMALMLRYLGIPARVAAGFTTGRYDEDKGEWTVADTNAHTWVEAWFAGYGWLPFDPTPGRGRLSSTYTSSSFTFDVSGAQSAFAGLGAAGLGLEALRLRLARGGRGETAGRGGDAAGSAGADEDASPAGGLGESLVALFLLLAAGVTLAMWLLKTIRRRGRYLTRDPRRLAGAVRLDLVDFLVDQRLAISPSATPAEVGAHVERELGVFGSRLAESIAEARYGPAPHAADAADRARHELRTVRAAIRRRLRTRDRLRGLLSPRSLGVGAG